MTDVAPRNADINFKDWEVMTRKLARLFQRWVGQRGRRISFDEAYSEVALRWVMARDGFNPELGFSFATYYTSAVRYWVKPFIAGMREQDQSDGAMRLDQPHDDCVDSEQHNIIADPFARSPDDALHARDARLTLESKTPLLHRFLVLMQEEPDDLLRELSAAKSQREFARSIGTNCYEAAAPTTLTPKVLAQMFGLNWKQRLRLKQETQEALSYVE